MPKLGLGLGLVAKKFVITNAAPAFPSNGLLAFYKLDDLTDASGNGNTLTDEGNVAFSSGKIGNCAQFNGTGQSLGLNSFSSPFSSNLPYTISLWYNVTTLKNYFSLVGCSETETINIHGDVDGGLSINNAGESDINIPNFFTAGSWNHLVVTRNSSNEIEVWKNGVSLGATASTDTYGNIPFLNIGNYDTSGEQFAMDGKIDAVGIWQRTLTQSEIESLYNNYNGLEP
jgi:hypothetical protein